MRQPFFEDLMTAMYPSGLLHTFGVNGKISGSVGAVGEMQEVLPLLHSPRGCGFHYRYSARRRHQPFYSVLTSNLEERDIICGGEEKLRQAIRDAWSRYRPGLIMVIPSPISDILNEDVRSVCAELRREGISVVGVQSELFSHRDKNYTRNRLKELAHQTITGDNRLEMELKGCGFTEALYALVEQVMEPSAQIPHSVNIETVGWGSEGKAALRELEVFLNGCGIQVNTWIPSALLSSLVHAPAAELNLVKRVRWARRMREKFGTAYLHIGGAGRYAGLDGICTFYRDIGQALRMEEAVEPVVLAARAQALEETAEARRRLGQARAVLVSRSIQQAPFELKSYVRDYSRRVNAVYERYTDLVEPFSIDESWLDITGSLHLFGGDAKALADEIRRVLREELGLTVSVGVSFNKIFAKMGSDYKKPDATTVISRENYQELLWPLPITSLLFVGRSAAAALEHYGVHTIGDLARLDREAAASILGRQGCTLHDYATGAEHSPVVPAREQPGPKSVGNGLTFPRNLVGWAELHAGVTELADEVAVRLRGHGLKCTTLQVTIRDPNFKDICRQKRLSAPTYVARELTETAMELIRAAWRENAPVRALTLTAQALVEEGEAGEQLDLFAAGAAPRRDKLEKLEKAMDGIRDKFGRDAIAPASTVHRDRAEVKAEQRLPPVD